MNLVGLLPRLVCTLVELSFEFCNFIVLQEADATLFIWLVQTLLELKTSPAGLGRPPKNLIFH